MVREFSHRPASIATASIPLTDDHLDRRNPVSFRLYGFIFFLQLTLGSINEDLRYVLGQK
jgi:hypothetical protein